MHNIGKILNFCVSFFKDLFIFRYIYREKERQEDPVSADRLPKWPVAGAELI